MKYNRKKYLKLIYILILFLIWNKLYSDDNNYSNEYKSYISNVKTICNNALYYKDPETNIETQAVIISKEYLEADTYFSIEFLNKNDLDFPKDDYTNIPLEAVKAQYRYNQNNIYNCWILQSQINSFKIVKELLKLDKSWTLKDTIEKKINSVIKKRNEELKDRKCILWKSLWLFKKKILNQTSYEYCKYNFYLEYLNEYYKNNISTNIWNSDWSKNNKTTINSINHKINSLSYMIQEEINHTDKMYDFAYNTYIQYENYLQIHILLELLKEDFIIFKTKLRWSLNPINQVVYKIINAMSN